MADARISQPTFTGGEISEDLYGRKDFARYQVAVRYANNVIIHATGGMSNRAGLRLVGEVKNSAKPGRLKTFEAAGDDAFLLVFGDLNMRPVALGKFIDNGGVPLEIVMPYTDAQLPYLYLEQSNDVVTMAHPDFAPRELARTSALVWTVTTVNFQPTVTAPGSVVATTTEGYTGYDASHLQVAYQYKVSAINADGDESLPSALATSSPLVFGYDKNYVTVTWGAVAGSTEYHVYKANNGVYGSIGTTPNTSFKDLYIAPDFTSGPQDGYNPFPSATNYPSIVFFSGQRRGFAATDKKPQTTWLTQSGNFKNMSRHTPSRDDDAIEFTIASQKKQDIYHILAMNEGLLVFTRSGEWRITGNDGGIITPSSILPKPQSQYGSTPWVKPLVVGESIIFVGRDQRAVYEMEYSFEVDRFKARDLTLLAKHLFKGRRIVASAYAADPFGVNIYVLDDGTALSLTYLKEHDVWGWSRINTKGEFLDVAVVPEGGRDVPYFLVRRRVQGVYKVFIEMMEARYDDDVRDAFFVDCGLSYDVPVTVVETTLGATTRIRVPAHGLVDGNEIELDQFSYLDQQDNVLGTLNGRYIVDAIDANWLQLTHGQLAEGIEIGDQVDSSDFIGAYQMLGVMRKCVSLVSGLAHLNGRKVIVLADGVVIDKDGTGNDLIITGGNLPDLGDKYARIHVGLSYRSSIQTLDVVNPQADDTGVEKAPGPVFARLMKSRGVKIGYSEDTAVELHSRDDEGYYDTPTPKSGVYPIEEIRDWGKDISVWFVEDDPLPMTVLGVTMDLNYGGDGG